MHDLPGVGQCLQDHYSAAVKLRCREKITFNDVMMNPLKQLAVGMRYLMFRDGPLTMAAGAVRVVRANPSGAGDTGCEAVDFAVFSSDNPAAGVAQILRIYGDRVSTAAGQAGGKFV